MKTSEKSTALLAKGLLCCCVLAALMYVNFITASPQAFAATKSYENLAGEKAVFSTISIKPHNIDCLSDNLTCDVTPAVSYGGSGCPNSGWNYAWLPDYGAAFPYTLSTGSYNCARATWDDHSLSQSRDCKFFAYIPSIFATAQISYGIYNSAKRIGIVLINQNNYASTDAQTDTYAYLGEWRGVYRISFSSNTGISDEYIAAAAIRFACFN